ncbi:unnamed protein product [Adineta ricciae]|uniref:Uncharacterized protein n=1 Tax=Adineta ricciae TaxID=249248 RepID=A0A815PVW8_ADIRI|nr:unnamed protein product [Adineta ricciae]CAF1453794.1 unnamed protein product [Adineta ricciae]
MSTSTSVPKVYQNANPLLYTFRDDNTGIQPYFIFPLQFLFFDLSLRFWDRIAYGTWYLPGELIQIELAGYESIRKQDYITYTYLWLTSHINVIYVMVPFKGLFSRKKPSPRKLLNIKLHEKAKEVTFDIFDIVFHCVPLIAHTIWYCIIQSNCGSGANSSTWNCYNLFGYRIYNYIFDSYTDFAYSFISKLYYYREYGYALHIINQRKGTFRRIVSKTIFWIAFALSAITFIFISAIILPYLFTNVIPMIVIYAFISMIYAYVVTVVNLILYYYTAITGRIFDLKGEEISWIKTQIKKLRHNRRLVVSFGIRLFPYIMAIMFNLSQYIYYGESFWTALTREADAREPADYFQRMSQAPQILHTILSTI